MSDSAWHQRKERIPFEFGDRVRVARYIPSTEGKEADGEYPAYVGCCGRYEGVWRNGAGEECPNVTYPCWVRLDGMEAARCFRVEELEREGSTAGSSE